MDSLSLLRRPGLRGSAEDRFWAMIERRAPQECWPWKGALSSRGYGRIQTPWSSSAPAHKVSLLLAGTAIPRGFVVDHVCRNRACVNPAHLRVVTAKENALENSASVVAVNAAKTHCKNGHVLTPDNLTATGLRRGWRLCRICQRAHGLRFYHAKKRKAAHLLASKKDPDHAK